MDKSRRWEQTVVNKDDWRVSVAVGEAFTSPPALQRLGLADMHTRVGILVLMRTLPLM